MLDIANTRFFQFTEKLISNDATAKNIVEGSPLILKVEDGLGKVSLGTGADAEVFEGVAFAGFVRPEQLSASFEVTINAQQLAVVLPHVAIGSVGGTIDGVNATVVTTGTPTTGQILFETATNTVTFATADAGKKAVILYRYQASLAEARFAAGDGYPGGFQLSELNGSIGVIHQGLVSTDQYDVSADWTEANISNIKVNADGKFSRGGTGAAVTNGRVIAAPGVNSAYLQLQLK